MKRERQVSYHVTHWTGEMEQDFPISRFSELLDELIRADHEHPDVSVTHESEWSITLYKNGIAVLENLEEGAPAHLGPVERDALIPLMVAVAEGRIQDVRNEDWQPGYPRPST